MIGPPHGRDPVPFWPTFAKAWLAMLLVCSIPWGAAGIAFRADTSDGTELVVPLAISARLAASAWLPCLAAVWALLRARTGQARPPRWFERRRTPSPRRRSPRLSRLAASGRPLKRPEGRAFPRVVWIATCLALWAATYAGLALMLAGHEGTRASIAAMLRAGPVPVADWQVRWAPIVSLAPLPYAARELWLAAVMWLDCRIVGEPDADRDPTV